MSQSDWQAQRPLLSAGLFLGLGLGGFFDGIVFHQLLQLHNMLSGKIFPDTLVNAEINMFWDGVFHVACYAMVCVGLALLWRTVMQRRVPLSTRALCGSMLAGAGLFNTVEGIMDHQLLGLHHVVERAQGTMQLIYDLMFLGSGIIMLALGGWLIARVTSSAGHKTAHASAR